MEVEDHGLVRGENGLELAVCQTVRVFGIRHQFEQVNDVHEPDLHVGQVLAQQCGGRQGLHRRHVAAARHDHVGFGTLVVAGPVPDADALRAVRDRRLHIQILQVDLLVRDDDVDVVDAAQAMVGDRQQAVGIGRQVDAHNARALVGHHVEKSGVLVRETIVVLPPHQGGDQQVERRYLGPPRQLVALFQPLGVLIEHRVDDVNERLIAVDQAMPAAQNITLQPPFHGVLAEHLHDAAVRGKLAAVGVFREVLAEPDLLADFIDGLELVGLRLVRPEDAEVLHVLPHHFAKEVAEGGDVAGQGRAGFLDFDGGVAEIRHLQWLA